MSAQILYLRGSRRGGHAPPEPPPPSERIAITEAATGRVEDLADRAFLVRINAARMCPPGALAAHQARVVVSR